LQEKLVAKRYGQMFDLAHLPIQTRDHVIDVILGLSDDERCHACIVQSRHMQEYGLRIGSTAAHRLAGMSARLSAAY
jgi:hypothetical protein